jgi:hypothetical protein
MVYILSKIAQKRYKISKFLPMALGKWGRFCYICPNFWKL